MINSVYYKVERAYFNNDFYSLLKGENGYYVGLQFIPVDVPTDWCSIIPEIYNLYNNYEGRNNKILKLYEDTIDELIKNDDVKDKWIVYNILFIQIKMENNGKSPFKINKNNFKILSNKINIFSNELKNIEDSGYNLFDDILRLSQIFKDKFGYDLLKNV